LKIHDTVLSTFHNTNNGQTKKAQNYITLDG